ncbi:Z1 domain-containing protein [Priestia aryabhattai]|uniref:Z1 domain-containing protein n=1 Tax=Priestia aryabhattai TaxID=412384 RepID=UPI001C8D9856|nr:Z1 domain-containing protein [Priestia aryabhattai]MBY0001434.1 Z1 domain-containing protein [Priestia aryabhattai]
MILENELYKHIRVARTLMDSFNCSLEEAFEQLPAIPEELKDAIKEAMEQEKPTTALDISMVADPNRKHVEWLPMVDRADWFYWPRLRNYLIDDKEWPMATVRSIDTATDKILATMEDPINCPSFTTKGLVVGYVQSGKTANYTSLIAKSSDAGYKLIIVIAGIHNSLRYQTQVRLDKELIGVVNGVPSGVGKPPRDKEWYTLTKADLSKGDFNPGHLNSTILNAEKPILIVIKKHSRILERLLGWLRGADEETLREIPCLIIDDEADQASINTRGNRPYDLDPDNETEEESPSKINEWIRQLVNLFNKKAYIAYTATPFANVLIDHEAIDREAGEDLYPSSFIMSLPRPHGYFGAKEIFGDDKTDGLDIIKHVKLADVAQLVPASRAEVEDFEPSIPSTLENAILDFILAGAARINRGQVNKPSSMLIHTSYRTTIQEKLAVLVEDKLSSIREQWRYERDTSNLVNTLEKRWNDNFRPLIQKLNLSKDVCFAEIINDVSVFLEKVEIRQLHSNSNDEIDYELEPDLKAIIIGGNRLSRGLTLEGLLVSYFVRLSNNYSYDTLMQMGRWFGYRHGYVELTRIYTTVSLERQFQALATVEEDLRRNIAKYDKEKRTPLQVGIKIRQHPGMLVTSPPKMRAARSVHVTYQNQISETTVFPFEDVEFLKKNLDYTKAFLQSLGKPEIDDLVWENVNSSAIIEYLQCYETDPDATTVRTDTISNYIRRLNSLDEPELINWTVAVMDRKAEKKSLGTIDLNIPGTRKVNLIQRTKRKQSYSLGAIVSSGDDEIGLSKEDVNEIKVNFKINKDSEDEKIKLGEELRKLRSPQQGVLLIYPISKYSGYSSQTDNSDKREPIFQNPDKGVHVIGLAFIFPPSESSVAQEYITGSVGVTLE